MTSDRAHNFKNYGLTRADLVKLLAPSNHPDYLCFAENSRAGTLNICYNLKTCYHPSIQREQT